MFKSLKIFAIVAGVALAILIGISAVGGMLEALRVVTADMLGTTGRNILMVVYLVLFFVLAFALAPLFVRGFVALQTGIGHGNLGIVEALKKNERVVTYVVWAIWACGMVIALPRAISDWFVAGP
jgi:hypothetical protein